jgi:hypothetical protein
LPDQTLTKERIDELNKTRQEQIDKIKEIEQLNLDKNHDLNLNEYEETWAALINEPSMDFKIFKFYDEFIQNKNKTTIGRS